MKRLFLLLMLCASGTGLLAQLKLGNSYSQDTTVIIDYATPVEYVIGGIAVTGAEYLDSNALIAITGLKIGDKIMVPGEALSGGIKKLWSQSILADVGLYVTKKEGNKIFFEIKLKERPRLSGFKYEGMSKSERTAIEDKIKLIRGRIVSDALIKNTELQVRKHFTDKGFFNAKVKIRLIQDSMAKSSYALLKIIVNKSKKVKINRIYFGGNEQMGDVILKKQMKKSKEKVRFTIPHDLLNTVAGTKSIRPVPKLQMLNKFLMFKHAEAYLNEHVRLNFLTGSKLIKSDFEEDKQNIIAYYNSKGYRDATILADSIYRADHRSVNIDIKVNEGRKYYFRNIYWRGNHIYDSTYLSKVLGIKKGDVYNQDELHMRLQYNPAGDDITSLYMDFGYLFFSIDPVEVSVDEDSIDVEMRISEGTQATINKVYVSGNVKTNDHVILREIKTLPGQKFNRSLLVRTQREIAQLGYFNPDKINPVPIPHAENGLVDLEYQVEEKSGDQIELSGGFSGKSIVGTAGIVFNNFSVRKIFHPGNWHGPLPSGDGQRLALRLQSNASTYQAYSLSFAEPWLGGKKPNSFSFAMSHSINKPYLDSKNSLQATTLSMSLGRRLKFPDDYFSLSNGISYTRYKLNNYSYGTDFGFNTGIVHNINFNTTIARSSIDNTIFPRRGSTLSLSVTATPPWSVLGMKSLSNNNSDASLSQPKLIEYHKWMFDVSHFTSITKNLVINVRAHFGFLGYYNSNYQSRFERFDVGGDGMTSNNYFLGTEVIGLRGYENHSIRPYYPALGKQDVGMAYNKFVFETRYLVSPNQNTPIWVHAFAEGANNYGSFKDYNPFRLYKAVGVGARIYMPYIGGLIGLDFGYGLDEIPGDKRGNEKRLMFTIGQQIR